MSKAIVEVRADSEGFVIKGCRLHIIRILGGYQVAVFGVSADDMLLLDSELKNCEMRVHKYDNRETELFRTLELKPTDITFFS